MNKCFAKGCERFIAPSMLMCRACWSRVPKHLQDAVYEHYRPGQERDKAPSREWARAAMAAKRSLSGHLED